MSDIAILLARQPIYDAALDVAAYELLHRSVHAEHSAVQDGNEASSRVLLSAFGALGIGSITEGKPAFINFTEHLIINPPPLDPGLLIVEVLEDVRATPQVLAGLRALRERGFRIALDDFRHAPELEPLVELADIVKLDVLSLSEPELRAEVRRLRNHPVRLLAEKIESWETFNHCVDIGCSYFQGFFLARPQPVHGRRMQVGRHTLLALLAELADPRTDAARLAATVATDPLLSFALIRLVNSPLYRRARPIESLRDAITLLGLERVRGWCYLLSLARIDGKPRELTRIAMVRARFCELLGTHIEAELGARAFVLGIFSALDAFLDQPLTELLGGMALSTDMSEALLARRGVLGELLTTALAFERAEWDTVPWQALRARHLEEPRVEDCYLESLQWAREALAAMQ